MEMKMKLGDTLRDKITGFTGVAVSVHEYLHGCRRFSLQPTDLRDGKPVETHSFDEPQLEIIADGGVAPKSGNTPGGPRDDPHSWR